MKKPSALVELKRYGEAKALLAVYTPTKGLYVKTKKDPLARITKEDPAEQQQSL